MTESTKNTLTIQEATSRGRAWLADVASSATTRKDVGAMLDDLCKDTADWACIMLALGEWGKDNPDLTAAIDSISEGATDYCIDWRNRHAK